MRLSLVLGAVLLVACSHPAAAPTSPSAAALSPAALECDKVIDHLVAMMPKAADAPQDAKDKLAGAMSQACVQDAWSADAKSCLMAAPSHDAAMTQCHDKLTQAQIDNAAQRISAVMGTAGPASSAAIAAPAAEAPAAQPPPPPADAMAAPAPAAPPPPAAPAKSSSAKKRSSAPR